MPHLLPTGGYSYHFFVCTEGNKGEYEVGMGWDQPSGHLTSDHYLLLRVQRVLVAGVGGVGRQQWQCDIHLWSAAEDPALALVTGAPRDPAVSGAWAFLALSSEPLQSSIRAVM